MPQIFKTPYRQINTFVNAAVGQADSTTTLFLIDKRAVIGEGTLQPLSPQAGFPVLQNFKPTLLPPFSSGSAALSWMQSVGFAVNYGLSGTLTLPAPNTVTVNPDTTVTLTYSSLPFGWSFIAASQVVSTFNQATSSATGQNQSYSTTAYSVTLNNVSGTFNTTNVITVSYINYAQQIPDPNRTEPICMTVWAAYQQLNSNPQTMPSTTIPQIFMSFLTDRETAFSPNSAPVSIVEPNNVVVLGNGNVQLFWNTVPAGWVYVPETQLGTSTIDQTGTAPATSVIVGTVPGASGPSGSAVGVEVTSVTGTFDTTHAISLVLDATQTVFSLFGNLGTGIMYVNCPYEISDNEDINVTYAQFFNYINACNLPLAVNSNKFTVFGVIGNLSTPIMQYNTLPTINSQFIVADYFPVIPAIGDVPNTIGMLTACNACMYAMNDVPYNPINNTICAGIFAPSNTTMNIVNSPLGSSEAVEALGWTCIAVNNNNQPYIVRAITTLLTDPNTNIPDTEFFPLTVWQIIALWKKQLYEFSNQSAFVNVRKSSYVKQQLLSGSQSLALVFQDEGMFINMSIYIPQFTITDDLTDASKYDINTPVQVSPELNAIQINITIVSVFNNTGLAA